MKDYKEAPVISNVCPACVELICSRYHSLADNLLDFLPPLGVAAKLAREEARGKSGLPDGDIGVFYLSPCPAKVQQIKKRLLFQHKRAFGRFVDRRNLQKA